MLEDECQLCTVNSSKAVTRQKATIHDHAQHTLIRHICGV